MSGEADFVSQDNGLSQSAAESGQKFDFKSVGEYRAVPWKGMLSVVLVTVWWCYLAVTVHLVIRPDFRNGLTERPIDIISQYVALFKQLDDEEYNLARSSFLAVLGMIVALALMLRGLEARSQDLPSGDSQAHRAWLERVMADAAREDLARALLLSLCGIYGFMVVCYGFLIGARGWIGLNPVFFLVLLVLYVVVANLPAFVVKGAAETLDGYVRMIGRVAIHAEWRFHNGVDDVVGDCKKDVLKGCFPKGAAVRRVAAWFVVIESLPAIIAIAVTLYRVCRDGGWQAWFIIVLWLLVVILWLSIAPLFVLNLKYQSISEGRGAVFEMILLLIFVMIVSAVTWWAYGSLFSGPLGCFYRIISFIAFFCWLVPMLLSLLMKPKNVVSKAKGRCVCLTVARLCLERSMGLRDVVCAWVDLALLKDRRLMTSYIFPEDPQISKKISVAAGLMVPVNYVMDRRCDNGEIESKNLRKYLSEVVKVTLPPVPETGSGAGKQEE
jgi:membrane protein